MLKQASLVLALAALCSADMHMMDRDPSVLIDQISGNVYDKMTGAIVANIKEMISGKMEEKIMGHIKEKAVDKMKEKIAGVIYDKVSGNIYDKMTSEILGNIKDMISEKKDEKEDSKKKKMSFEKLCKCKPGDMDDDFTDAELEAWGNKVSGLEAFVEENGMAPEDELGVVQYRLKFANQVLENMKKLLSGRDYALKAAALSCVASGDVEIKELRESLDGNVYEGIDGFDMDKEANWTREELMFKIIMIKFKVLVNVVKKHKYAFLALNDCRMSRAFDPKDIMKALAMSEEEMMDLDATARVALKLDKIREAINKVASFVYKHRSILKIPEYCLEVAAKGKILSELSEKFEEMMWD